MNLIKILTALLLLLINSYNLHAEKMLESTSREQQIVELTIYNQNIALVKDTRKIKFPIGEFNLKFMDVASSIIPETVHIKSKNHKGSLTVLEQNYEYDLINSNKLLDKYVGKEIRLVSYDNDHNPERTVKATLLSNNNGQIYEIEGKIHIGYPGYHILPKIPENFISRPTLIWSMKNETEKEHLIEAAYLARDIKWKSDYVLAVNSNDTLADLTGWVTINNRSGAAFKNAGLKLIAGDVNRVPDYDNVMLHEAKGFAASAPRFKEESFFEYHIYTLDRPATVKNNQQKQLNLLKVAGIPIKKEYFIKSPQHYFNSRYGSKKQKQDVGVYILLENTNKSGLGMPLPAGKIRLYKSDTEGSLQFIGEDSIDHTPKNEKIKIKAGNAFDIVCERVQVDYQKLYSNTYETEWEISIRNRKDEDVTVFLEESINGDWKIIENSHKYKKTEAFKVKFEVHVEKNKEEKVKYRVKVKY